MAYSDNDKKAKLTYLYVYMYLCATLVILYLLQKSIQWPDVIVVVVEGISFSSVWQYLVFERKKIHKNGSLWQCFALCRRRRKRWEFLQLGPNWSTKHIRVVSL